MPVSLVAVGFASATKFVPATSCWPATQSRTKTGRREAQAIFRDGEVLDRIATFGGRLINKVVASCAASQSVGAKAADQSVVARAADQGVVARSAIDGFIGSQGFKVGMVGFTWEWSVSHSAQR